MEEFTEESSWVNVPSYSDEEIDQLLKQEGGIGQDLKTYSNYHQPKLKKGKEYYVIQESSAESKDPNIKGRLRKKN